MDETPLLLVYENDDENLNSLMNMVQMEKKKKKNIVINRYYQN